MDQDTLELLVEGGKARPGPASAQKLAMYKINMGQLFQEINDKTKDYAGMNVPVKVIIDKKTGEYSIQIGTPPVSSLIRKELGLKKIAPQKEGGEKREEGEKEKNKKEEKKEEPAEEEKKEEGKKGEKKEEPAEEEEGEKKGKEKKDEKKDKKKEKVERIIVGNLNIDQCVKIANMKRDNLLAKDMKRAVKEVVGSVVSMPLTVEGKSPKEVLKDIDEGKYDDKLVEKSSS